MAEARLPSSIGSGKSGEVEAKKIAARIVAGDEREVPSVGASSSQDQGIETMFDQLLIEEEEFDDFVIEDDPTLEESTRWMAVARVLIDKKFSHDALFQQMHNAWNPAREITMRAVGENRFVIQCFCLGDWEKVTERGPWLFREWPLIMAPYDGFSDPEQIELNFMPIWVQVHKIPEGYRRRKMW
jgi:hypothetical protein